MDLQKALGHRIRALRKERSYSQEGFADACGVHRTFMGAVERGEKNLSFQSQIKIAKALGVTLSQMMSGLETATEESLIIEKVTASMYGEQKKWRDSVGRIRSPSEQGINTHMAPNDTMASLPPVTFRIDAQDTGEQSPHEAHAVEDRSRDVWGRPSDVFAREADSSDDFGGITNVKTK